jgi:hypothetical protein
MVFKVKDLMINIAASGKIEERTPKPPPTCTGGSAMFEFMTLEFASAPALAKLKKQLSQELAMVEKQQALVKENLAPKTVAEVDLVIRKLNGAIEELQILRAKLAKKPKPTKGK